MTAGAPSGATAARGRCLCGWCADYVTRTALDYAAASPCTRAEAAVLTATGSLSRFLHRLGLPEGWCIG